MEDLGEWLNLGFSLAVFGMIIALATRGAWRRKPGPVRDGLAGEQYRIFTTDYDIVVAGDGLDKALASRNEDYARGWVNLGPNAQETAVERADQLFSGFGSSEKDFLGQTLSQDLSDAAITLLLDRSGSMRGEPMAMSAALAKVVAEALLKRGARVELLGYSTVGWRGGYARQKWLAKSKPKRPGRLCATLQMIYKSGDEACLSHGGWVAMNNPNSLRENVDGEAIEWAAERLEQSGRKDRYLIVMSDGAPVDDSTMHENGPNYLVRHLVKVLAHLHDHTTLQIGALGIGVDVSEYYAVSETATDLDGLSSAMRRLLERMVQ